MPAFNKKKKDAIVISGYFGFENTGDEAVLASVVQTIKKDLPQARIIALSANPDLTAKSLEIEAIERDNLKAIFAALSKARLFISGGGSLFQDVTSLRSVVYYSLMIHLARLRRVPVLVLAQGLGPLQTGLGRWITKRALKKARALTWRDKASLELAKALGIKNPKMFLSCDPVLCWQPEKVTVPLLPPGKKIAFSLRPWFGLNRKELAKTMDTLIGKGYNIVFLPLQKGVDEQEMEKIQTEMKAKPWHIPALPPAGVWQIISDMDLVVSMRLHSLIMAAALNIPAAAISYDPKIKAFCDQTGQPLLAEANNLNADQLSAAIEKLMLDPVRAPYVGQERLWKVSREQIKLIYKQN